MMRVVALVVWLVGCSSNPINTCDDIDIDCCESDIDCVEVYGSLYPECVDPGPFSRTWQTKLAAATAASQAAASSQTTGRQAVAGTVNRGVATAATTVTLLSRIEELERQMAAQKAINEAQQSEIEDLETELSEAIEELGSAMVQADQNWDGLLKVVQPAASVALDVLNNGEGEVYNREGLIAHEAIEAYISLQGENLTGGQEGIARLIALLAKAWAYYDGASLNSVFQKNAPEAAAPEGGGT